MNGGVYRYFFSEGVPLGEVRDSLLLSVLAAEGVHGRAQVLLGVGYAVDEGTRACVVDATSPVGETVSQIFTGLLTREFGENAFTVERDDRLPGSFPGPLDDSRARQRHPRASQARPVSRTGATPGKGAKGAGPK